MGITRIHVNLYVKQLTAQFCASFLIENNMLKPYYLFVERQISRLLSVSVSDGAIRASLVLHDREVEILRLFCRGCKWLFCLSESVKILHCVPPPFLSFASRFLFDTSALRRRSSLSLHKKLLANSALPWASFFRSGCVALIRESRLTLVPPLFSQ